MRSAVQQGDQDELRNKLCAYDVDCFQLHILGKCCRFAFCDCLEYFIGESDSVYNGQGCLLLPSVLCLRDYVSSAQVSGLSFMKVM